MSDIRSGYPPRNDGRKDEAGNWLADTIADLTVEPVLTPGESVTVSCQMCEGTGEPRWERDDSCWRCKGKGEITLTAKEDNCPCCGESLLGDQIALKHMEAYGSTHFKTKVGMYGMDQTLAYLCPHCNSLWDRYTGKPLDESGRQELARKMERAY